MGSRQTPRQRKWAGCRTVKNRQGIASYCYVRPLSGAPEIRIFAEIGTREWEAEYLRARGGEQPTRRINRKAGSFASMTVEEAIEHYRGSTTCKNLAADTITKREQGFRHLLKTGCGPALLSELRQDKLLQLLQGLKPKQHRNIVMDVRMLCRYINQRADANAQPKFADPTINYPFPKLPESDGFKVWAENEIELFREHWALGTLPRTILELAFHTGQRGSDIRSMKWSHIVPTIGEDGEHYQAIAVTQSKTGTSLLLPISDELHEALIAWLQYCENRQAQIIANRDNAGKPGSANRTKLERTVYAKADRNRAECADYIIKTDIWLYRCAKQRFKEVMREAIKAIGLPTFKAGDENYEMSFSTHGLRKSAITAICDAGGGFAEMMATSGHSSTRNLLWYIKKRDQKRAALQGMKLRQAHAERLKAAKENRKDEATNVVTFDRNKLTSV